MMLDEIYGDDVDERIRNGEAALRERLLPEVEWNQADDSRVVEELLGGFNAGSDEAE
jgi:hypothetical protein